MRTSTIVKHTSEDLKKMKSKTDWQWIKCKVAEGIEPDMTSPDDSEITDKEFAVAVSKRRAGRPPKVSPKEHINLRLDADILAAFRAKGKGWQTLINKALKEYVRLHERST